MRAVDLTLLLFSYSVHALRMSNADLEPDSFAIPSTDLNGANAQTPKIVIFITTIRKEEHMKMLSSCWPRLMRNKLPILSRADVILHSKGNQTETELRQVMSDWPNKIVRVATSENDGYEQGAISAISEAVEKNWFEGYDWVIRINPDVVIMKEAALLDRMTANHAGIFANCGGQKMVDGQGADLGGLIHTDFFAVRPNFLLKQVWVNATSWRQNPNSHPFSAEAFASMVGFKNIIEQRLDSWVIARGKNGICRVKSDVMIHEHKSQVERCNQFSDDPASFANIGNAYAEANVLFLAE